LRWKNLYKKEFGKDFEDLKTNVKNLLDFNTFQYKDTYLGRRFDSRLRAFHLDSYHAYWDILRNDSAEQERLLKDLTINVTEFFRDNPVYDVFKKEIVTNVLNQNPGKIRIWSAGSSDGKEAYSIAMIFTEALHGHNVKNRVEIIGTDIDKDCLNHATNGVYESRAGIVQTDIAKQVSFIKNTEQYFEIGENTFHVKPHIKELVNFQYHDLISGLKKKNFDIIFCRNVVIYFTRELQDVLYKDFYNALKPGGYFIMGKTETLIGESKDLFKPYNLRERIFTKE
jgi:chemotaxis protein methyltransferase CheR